MPKDLLEWQCAKHELGILTRNSILDERLESQSKVQIDIMALSSVIHNSATCSVSTFNAAQKGRQNEGRLSDSSANIASDKSCMGIAELKQFLIKEQEETNVSDGRCMQIIAVSFICHFQIDIILNR